MAWFASHRVVGNVRKPHFASFGLLFLLTAFLPETQQSSRVATVPVRGFSRNRAAYLVSQLIISYAASVALGGRPLKVNIRLIAKTVTAVISVTADTGSHDQAQLPNP